MFAVFFFFKQKTAYEVRISDWSSDVCSSDLVDGATLVSGRSAFRIVVPRAMAESQANVIRCRRLSGEGASQPRALDSRLRGNDDLPAFAGRTRTSAPGLRAIAHPLFRSEEHTSELQSLMSHSSAVLCL